MPIQSTFPNELTIRPATEADAPIIYAFLCDLEETTLDTVSFQSIFSRNINSPLIYYLVAESQNELVGFLSCHVQYLLHHGGKVGEIQELYVKPDRRSMGIGQQLIAHLTELARTLNVVNLEVTTNQKRSDTIRFYERESFLRTHVKFVKPLHS